MKRYLALIPLLFIGCEAKLNIQSKPTEAFAEPVNPPECRLLALFKQLSADGGMQVRSNNNTFAIWSTKDSLEIKRADSCSQAFLERDILTAQLRDAVLNHNCTNHSNSPLQVTFRDGWTVVPEADCK